MRLLENICEVVITEDRVINIDTVVRDAKDLHVLAAAVENQCDFIITGDKDLLELQEYKGIYIFNPADFLGLIDVRSRP